MTGDGREVSGAEPQVLLKLRLMTVVPGGGAAQGQTPAVPGAERGCRPALLELYA